MSKENKVVNCNIGQSFLPGERGLAEYNTILLRGYSRRNKEKVTT